MLDTLLTFLNENQIIAAILTGSGLASPVFGIFAALFRKKSNLNLAALNAIDDDNKNLTKKLIAAESQLNLYDPNLIVAQLNQLKAEGAPEAELQKAAEKYFFFQNKAITAAAKHLAECALQHEPEDGKAALHEAKRCFTLGRRGVKAPRGGGALRVYGTRVQSLERQKMPATQPCTTSVLPLSVRLAR